MISAIVLAAGQSVRMGVPKMLLPWGDTTVIGRVISTLLEAGLKDVHVVTGAYHAELTKEFKETTTRLVFNHEYANGEMLTSLQVGLKDIGEETDAILVVLGDQPQIESQVVQTILARYQATRHAIIVPSYRMHRGHPWLVGNAYFKEILALRPPLTLQDFLNDHNLRIDYLDVDTESVIQDLDTQEDYTKYKPV